MKQPQHPVDPRHSKRRIPYQYSLPLEYEDYEFNERDEDYDGVETEDLDPQFSGNDSYDYDDEDDALVFRDDRSEEDDYRSAGNSRRRFASRDHR